MGTDRGCDGASESLRRRTRRSYSTVVCHLSGLSAPPDDQRDEHAGSDVDGRNDDAHERNFAASPLAKVCQSLIPSIDLLLTVLRNYRLGLSRPNGMRTLENSSSSEEEDRTDLLGRNFQVPRPKSRSNASVTSGIYYDVDYLPSGEHHLYGTANTAGSQIQMSTYTPGRTPSTTYYK